MRKVAFGNKILVIGAGGVSRCTLPLLLKHLTMPPENITVIDFTDYREALSAVLVEGVQFVRDRITQEGYKEELAKYVGPGDMIIDLAWNIDAVAILTWCHDHGVTYVNTSTELWDPYAPGKKVTDRTLYVRHMAMRKMIADWGTTKGPTAIVEHGANPGLVSHFTKMGLLDIAKKLLSKKGKNGNGNGQSNGNSHPNAKAIERAVEAQQFNVLAHLLGVKVIHISEIDTQISIEPNSYDEFLNTWSVEGFFEEGTSPAEMGWGTHEQTLPPDAHQHETGPKNQICLERFGMNTFVRSRVPSDEILGMVVRHGEAFTISDTLTVWDEKGKAVYRPTVHYAYSPCLAAIGSLHALRANHYKMQPKFRIMNDDIVSGVDELGVLLMGHEFTSWWTGSILGIDETNRLVPGQNATTLQVAASVLGAVVWMIKNPNEGVLVPDQLPHTEILKVAKPYLGDIVSMPLDWHPDDSNVVDTPKAGTPFVNDDSAWQFNRFLWKF